MVNTPNRIMVVLLVLWLCQLAIYYPQLPDQVASHFDNRGVPNGWSSKLTFFELTFVMIVLLAGVFLYMPVFQRRISIKMTSLPHREYWLAPERRDETWTYVQRRMLWLGVATVALMLGITQLVIHANLNPPVALSTAAAYLLGGYITYSLVWTVRFVSRFMRVPDQDPPEEAKA